MINHAFQLSHPGAFGCGLCGKPPLEHYDGQELRERREKCADGEHEPIDRTEPIMGSFTTRQRVCVYCRCVYSPR